MHNVVPELRNCAMMILESPKLGALFVDDHLTFHKGGKNTAGFDKVFYPGQRSAEGEAKYMEEGIVIVDNIYNYLVSDTIHNDAYDQQNPFAT